VMFDLHVHAGPDVLPRLARDVEIGRRYLAAGFEGYVLKAHYESTVGRAAAVSDVTGLAVVGGLVLNQHVGGVNPAAVRAALAAGGRVIWMPTADSHAQQAAGLPRLCCSDPRPGDHTYALPPVDGTSERAALLVLSLLGEADAVLATGHVSGAEVAWLLDRATRAGVRRVLMTHPGYTVPSIPAREARDLAELSGALVEITCYQLLHQPGCTAAALAAYVRTVGIERCVLSSDAGQPDSPSPPEALQLLIDALAGQGLDRGALVAAASERPRGLVLS
jgi:hypothetical protein